jgi:hypothetical protein
MMAPAVGCLHTTAKNSGRWWKGIADHHMFTSKDWIKDCPTVNSFKRQLLLAMRLICERTLLQCELLVVQFTHFREATALTHLLQFPKQQRATLATIVKLNVHQLQS